jgi:hypothetical protein
MSVRVRSSLLVLVLVVVTAGSQLVAVPASLAGATGSDGHGTVRVGASTGISGAHHPVGSGPESGTALPEVCLYKPAPQNLSEELGIGGPLPGEWLLYGCPGFDFGLFNSNGIIWMRAVWVSYVLPKVVLTNLAELAESSITLPSPVIRTDPAGTSYVNLSTWFWVAPSAWHPFTATARAGSVSATATATPIRVEFSTGDGGSVTCTGPGTPYRSDEPSSTQSTCSHDYKLPSIGQESLDGNPNNAAYLLTATITWSVTWEAVGAPGGGTLPPITTTSTARLRVEQIESVESP